MDIRLHHPGDLTTAQRASWAEMQSLAWESHGSALANPFLAPEFAAAVGRRRRGVRIAELRDGGEAAGFFAFEQTALGTGRAVGLGLSDCQGLVHRPGLHWDARELLRSCGLAVWEYDHLAAGQQPFTAGGAARFPSPVIDVQQGYEAYLAGLRSSSPRFARTTLAKERRLGRDIGGLRYVHDERDPAALRTLLGWKSAQYRRTGRSDRFARPWIVGLVHELFHTRGEHCAGLLSVLYAGGRPVAAHFGLRSPHILACWFPAYDPAYAKYSPGLVLHLRMAQAAADRGMGYLDLGRGAKEYKESLKTRCLPVYEGWTMRRHPVALVHRARRAPLRALRNTVTAEPRLREPADRLLRMLGRLRSAPPGAGKP